MSILCVFSGDSLKTYFKKGEIKSRYYNPGNVFSEVHFFSFSDSEVEAEKVQELVGNAKIYIHLLGNLTPFNVLEKIKETEKLMQKIKPDVVRTYMPILKGYIAAKVAKKLGVKFVISLHGDYDRDVRFQYWNTGQYKKWLMSTAMKYSVERFIISSAVKVICAYEFPVKYAKECGAKNVTVIYNKVYPERFEGAKPAIKSDVPIIICVGRLIPEKNQQCLIKAVKNLPVKLLLIGNGPEYDNLVELSKKLGIESKVIFIKSIPNKDIPSYYASATIFALPIKYGGVAIPVIEAMAAKLPVVVARPDLDPNPEIASEVGIVVDNTPEAFEKALRELLSNKKLREELIKKGEKKMQELNGNKMEQKEADLYLELISTKYSNP